MSDAFSRFSSLLGAWFREAFRTVPVFFRPRTRTLRPHGETTADDEKTEFQIRRALLKIVFVVASHYLVALSERDSPESGYGVGKLGYQPYGE